LRFRLRSRTRTLWGAACAFVAASALTSDAFADTSFALSWRGGPRPGATCLTQAALQEAVERKLGRSPFTSLERADIRIEGEEIALGRDRFRATVTQRDRTGTVLGSRELETQRCTSLLRAATLVVALIIDPYGERSATDGGQDGPPPAPPVSSLPPAAPPPAALPALRSPPPPLPAARPVARAWALSLGAGAGSSVGILPSASVTLLALARLKATRSRWSFDWRGGYSLSQTLREGNVRGEFAAVEQQIRACFELGRWPSGQVDACGGLLWGAVIPNTRRVSLGDDSWRPILGPTGGLGLQLGRTQNGARIDLGFALPSREYSFFFRDVTGARKLFYSTDGVLFLFSVSGLGTISS
jgi:hypothetical protein